MGLIRLVKNEASMGSVLASGTIGISATAEKTLLVEDEMITATNDGQVVYYYVVLEYPNLDSDQSSDMGGVFDGKVSVEESDAKPDVNIMAVYTKGDADADYVKVESIPGKSDGLGFNKSKSTCTNVSVPEWDSSSWKMIIGNLIQSGTSCYLYFDKESAASASDIILGGTATDDSMFAGISGDGVYTWTKGDYSGGDKPIKYSRGNVDNNWVVFGKDGSNYIWWRIIRSNSNGSLRMIYAGLSANKVNSPLTTGVGTRIGESVFNASNGDNAYVGFKYTGGQPHGIETSSTIFGI